MKVTDDSFELDCPQFVDSSEATIRHWWDDTFGYCSDGVLFSSATKDDMPQYAKFICHRRTYWLTTKNIRSVLTCLTTDGGSSRNVVCSQLRELITNGDLVQIPVPWLVYAEPSQAPYWAAFWSGKCAIPKRYLTPEELLDRRAQWQREFTPVSHNDPDHQHTQHLPRIDGSTTSSTMVSTSTASASTITVTKPPQDPIVDRPARLRGRSALKRPLRYRS